jgi:hypothetical protein
MFSIPDARPTHFWSKEEKYKSTLNSRSQEISDCLLMAIANDSSWPTMYALVDMSHSPYMEINRNTKKQSTANFEL